MRIIMERILRSGSEFVLYDPDRLPEPAPDWFRAEAWAQAGGIVARYGGRGEALAVDGFFGAAVLKSYRRGGLVQRVVRKRYAWLGIDRARSVREWRVLRALHEAGLPVPEPLAAFVHRIGPTYEAALLTRRIRDARPLSEVAADFDAGRWRDVDALIDRFANAGLVHADLNATNILVAPDESLWMIDFDRARISDRPVRPAPMHARLARSLAKLGIDQG
jgi:3-deoxy-D-manno-octulosonic acid kinase